MTHLGVASQSCANASRRRARQWRPGKRVMTCLFIGKHGRILLTYPWHRLYVHPLRLEAFFPSLSPYIVILALLRFRNIRTSARVRHHLGVPRRKLIYHVPIRASSGRRHRACRRQGPRPRVSGIRRKPCRGCLRTRPIVFWRTPARQLRSVCGGAILPNPLNRRFNTAS